MAEKWKLTGSYLEACSCDKTCPCIFLSDPTGGECTAFVGWHIDSGNLGSVTLDGLNVALAVYSPGNMAQVKWTAALYLDSTASEGQQKALTQIFTGQVGGHPGMLVQHVGDVLGIKSVPITYKSQGKKYSLQVADIADVEIEAIAGQGGVDVTVENHPLAIAPGYPVVVANSERLSYQDYDFNWEISEKNGLYSPFTYQGD